MHTWLKAGGFEPFLDQDLRYGVQPGAEWKKVLYRRVNVANAMLLVLTPDWLESKWCFAEFALARSLGKPIFPVIDAKVGALSVASDIQNIDLTKNREEGLRALERALRDIAEVETGGFHWDRNRSPYPGSLSFGEEDAAIFFGRGDEIRGICERARLLSTLGGGGLLLLLGDSGVGKSSILRAGVLPRLKLDRGRWIVLPPFRPGELPLDELLRALLGPLGQHENVALVEQQRGGSNGSNLTAIASALRKRQYGPSARIVVAIDQLEEVFDLPSEEARDGFFSLLEAVSRSDAFLVLASLRSDYLLQLESRFQESGFHWMHKIIVSQLNRSYVRDIVFKPARLASIDIDEKVVDSAVADMGSGEYLPLLAFTLRELYERSLAFRQTRCITLSDYEALADRTAGVNPIQNAVRKVADAAIAASDPKPEELAALQKCFVLQLATTTDDGRVLRRPADWDVVPKDARRLIDSLATARVLTIMEKDGKKAVEVTHEALLRHWTRAQEWLSENQTFVSWQRRLKQEYASWANATDKGKIESLLSGMALSEAVRWLDLRLSWLTDEEIAYIKISKYFNALQSGSYRRAVFFGRIWFTIAIASIVFVVFTWYIRIQN